MSAIFTFPEASNEIHTEKTKAYQSD